jgi:hypothetical protein
MRKVSLEEVTAKITRAEVSGVDTGFICLARQLLAVATKRQSDWERDASYWALNAATRFVLAKHHPQAKACLVFVQMLLVPRLHGIYEQVFHSIPFVENIQRQFAKFQSLIQEGMSPAQAAEAMNKKQKIEEFLNQEADAICEPPEGCVPPKKQKRANKKKAKVGHTLPLHDRPELN